MTAVLVVTKGPMAGQRLNLQGELVIGREGVAVTIEDSELSRRHAAVRQVTGGYEVEDLGSLNGTFVNGQRITAPTQVAGGDSIKVGQTVMELEAAQAPATMISAAPAAAPVPAAPVAPGVSGVPSEAFGTYAAQEGEGRRRGIASRQLGPMLAAWAIVGGTAAALAIYFADH
jgi:pSer/pThr/pTyr-binding forkhead associated (FHA) protein